MRPKRALLLISYHFYPSSEVGAKRPSETALYLSRNGLDVTVLRARDRTDPASYVPPGFDELRIVSVLIPRRQLTALWLWLKRSWRRDGRDSVRPGVATTTPPREAAEPGRIAWMRMQILACMEFLQGDKGWLTRCALKLLPLCRRRRFDAVIASGPPMAGYVCGAFVSRVFGVPLILDFRDPWYLHGDPERGSTAPGHFLSKLEDRLAQYCISQCTRILVASPGIERHLQESFALDSKRIDLVRNGFDQEAVITEPLPVGKLKMLYAGTLYFNRNPFPFLEALATVCDEGTVQRERISLKLVGSCEEWGGTELAPWLQEHGIGDVVTVMPTVSALELRKLVVESNVLVNFAQGQPRQIPAKSYEYIASGREVLTIAESDSDVADLFREAGMGVLVEPGDGDGMRKCLRGLYEHLVIRGEAADVRQDVSTFSRASQLDKLMAAVDDTTKLVE